MYSPESQPDQTPKKNSNVIYFLIVVILALLGTDVYLYMKKNTADSRIVAASDEQVNAGKQKMSVEMQAKNDSLQTKIRVLRVELAKGKLTADELIKVQEDVKQLRYFVTKYTADIDELKQQNATLTTERDTLKTNLNAVSAKATNLSQQATTLQKQNQDLSNKVQIASALKIGQANVVAYKIKNSGKEVDVSRASPAKKIKINFTIASNAVAQKGSHDIYVRIIDPAGNFIAGNGGTFTSDGQDQQYTYRTSIDFKDDGSGFTLDWVNPAAFQKGTYTVLLYADGYTMGKTSLVLK